MKNKILKTMLYFVSVLAAILVLAVAILWIKSPGVSETITDYNGNTVEGSASAIEKITLGGQEQYIIIRGVDYTKPIMLFLHGGPGSPEFAFIKHYNPAIENDYVMVYWEQRGAGKSYSKNIPPESMTLEQMIADTRELSEYLANRFNKEKIFIMGHSWGSLLGILTAYNHPELYYAYFGIGQVCDQFKGEQISYSWALEQASERNDSKAIKTLNGLHFPDSTASIDQWLKYLMMERRYVNRYGGGTTREITGMWPLVKLVMNSGIYTLSEKLNFMNASMFSLKHLWLDVIHTNLFNKIDSMSVPVHIFQGVYDYTTPYPLAKDFYQQLKAPHKDFISFENSAHSPIMEEPEKFNSILKSLTDKY
ncbi:alpha/beta fold hydrolase [Perlabentimonas gracilis]|uniref:alpha/beta fold hydrolase n=1 Tax=Perlabentimonas gracilis TaxID=2715279 RepID=UPI00140D5D7F|nr:alpha/beta hydrolase [Perlabentimonas gracilis]NHB69121.1 alpha/beta hydrolase [Perlabentimonas gracilis]